MDKPLWKQSEVHTIRYYVNDEQKYVVHLCSAMYPRRYFYEGMTKHVIPSLRKAIKGGDNG